MDYRDTQYVNANGKGIFANIGKAIVKKDESGKGKLTAGAKVAAGTIAAGALIFGISKLTKKKGADGSVVTEQTSETKSSETPSVATTSTYSQTPSVATTSTYSQTPSGGKKNNTLLYVGIGAGVLAVIGVIIYASKK